MTRTEITQLALEQVDKTTLEKYLMDKMTDTVKNNTNNLNKPDKSVMVKLNDSRIFTSFHKAKVINKICQLHPNLTDNQFFERYSKDVINVRNLFGHAKEENGVFTSHINNKTETFDEARCIETRKTLTSFREELVKLKETITE